MGTLKQILKAKIIKVENDAALLLAKSESDICLRYALVDRGNENEIFPESLIDDWGHEISTLELYNWIQENGLHFPRAEIFGYEKNGARRQFFLREFDITSGYLCYAFETDHAPLSSGIKIDSVLIRDSHVDKPERIRRPVEIIEPLRSANVCWWLVPSSEALPFDYNLTD